MTTTYLRVHPGISTISQYLDYSPAAAGMTYRNAAMPTGVTIDGSPDVEVQTGTALGPRLDWEQVAGTQGTMTIVNRLATDMPGVEVGSYYEDDLTPAAAQCTGYSDAQAWGASGAALRNAGQNTDPTLGAAFTFTGTRTRFFEGPGGEAADAALRSAQVDSPLVASVGEDGGGGLVLSARRAVELRRNGLIAARLKNTSDAVIEDVRVCGKARKRLARVARCDRVSRLDPGRIERVGVRVRPRPAARGALLVRLRARAPGYPAAKAKLRVRP